MIIILLADIHGCLDYLSNICDEVTNADLVLIAGDITDFGCRGQAKKILSAIEKYNSRILAVPGNCDRPGVDEYLSERGMSLNCNCAKVGEITFLGIGGSLPCPGHTPNESPEENFESHLDKIALKIPSDGRVVFVSHQPAWGTGVDLAGNRHSGSRTIRAFIEINQPLLALSGHIHEAGGVDSIGRTKLVNPGPFRNGLYAYIELNEKIDKIEIRTP